MINLFKSEIKYKVIDNFLPQKEYEYCRENIVYSHGFPWFIQNTVANMGEETDAQGNVISNQYWNWYATHTYYKEDAPRSEGVERIHREFKPRLEAAVGYKSLVRIKANFYPPTLKVEEHMQHIDFAYEHHAGIYSLHDCDGFTRLADGTKINSVGNRMLIFDGSQKHNSSTCTNHKGRFNIGFNWL